MGTSVDRSAIQPEILTLIDEFARSGLRELHVRRGDFELYLSNDPMSGAISWVGNAVTSPSVRPIMAASADADVSKPATAAVRPAVDVLTDLPADAVIVRAPNLGTFYRSPKPGAAAYVEIGAVVGPGDELCLIEVMKLFTTVCADMAGTVQAVLVDDGVMVEADQPLFVLVRA